MPIFTLHLQAFFINPNPPLQNEGIAHDQVDEQTKLVQLFCDTAVMVEQELQNETLIPNGPLLMLKMLHNTRKRTKWIAS
jgi:hypothetical protein